MLPMPLPIYNNPHSIEFSGKPDLVANLLALDSVEC